MIMNEKTGKIFEDRRITERRNDNKKIANDKRQESRRNCDKKK